MDFIGAIIEVQFITVSSNDVGLVISYFIIYHI